MTENEAIEELEHLDWCGPECSCPRGEAFKLAIAVLREREQLQRERDNWDETAKQQFRNSVFYRDLLTKIGERFGKPAYTSDDGSIQDSVLVLKVPELVEQLQREVERLTIANIALTENNRLAIEDIKDQFQNWAEFWSTCPTPKAARPEALSEPKKDV